MKQKEIPTICFLCGITHDPVIEFELDGVVFKVCRQCAPDYTVEVLFELATDYAENGEYE